MQVRILIGLVVLVIATASIAGLQQTWKGMIVAEPAQEKLTLDQRLIGLTNFDHCSVVIEGLSEGLNDAMTTEEIKGWVSNRLTNAGLKVVEKAEQSRTYSTLIRTAKTDEAVLLANERLMADVYVNINSLQSGGRTTYSISMEARRAGFIHPGYFTLVTVWERGSLGYFGSGIDRKSTVREKVNELIDLFEADLKKCRR